MIGQTHCDYCGDEISPERMVRRARYCSNECYIDSKHVEESDDERPTPADERVPKEYPPIEPAASYIARKPGVFGGPLLFGYLREDMSPECKAIVAEFRSHNPKSEDQTDEEVLLKLARSGLGRLRTLQLHNKKLTEKRNGHHDQSRKEGSRKDDRLAANGQGGDTSAEDAVPSLG